MAEGGVCASAPGRRPLAAVGGPRHRSLSRPGASGEGRRVSESCYLATDSAAPRRKGEKAFEEVTAALTQWITAWPYFPSGAAVTNPRPRRGGAITTRPRGGREAAEAGPGAGSSALLNHSSPAPHPPLQPLHPQTWRSHGLPQAPCSPRQTKKEILCLPSIWLGSGRPSPPVGRSGGLQASQQLTSGGCSPQPRVALIHPQDYISPLEASDEASPLDFDTLSLQDRAAQLLLRSEISPSSSSSSTNEVASIPVSSEGLPSPLAPFTSDSGPGPHPREPAPLTRTQVPLPSVSRPEDDILFQWRLRRKMELAQEECADGPQAQSWLPRSSLVAMTVAHSQPEPHMYAPAPVVTSQLNSLVPLSNPQPPPPAPLGNPQQNPPVPFCGSQIPPAPLYGSQHALPVLPCGSQQVPPVPPCGSQHIPSAPLYGSQQVPPVPTCGSQQVLPVPVMQVPTPPLYGSQQVPPVPPCGSQHVPSAPLFGSQQVPPVPPCGSQQGPAVLCPHVLSPCVSHHIPQPNLAAPLNLLQPTPPASSRAPHPSPVGPLCLPQPSPHSPETGSNSSPSGSFPPSSKGPSESKRKDHKPRKARNPGAKSRSPGPGTRPGPLLKGALEHVVATRLFPAPSEGCPPPPSGGPPPAEAAPPGGLLALASGLLAAAEDSDGTEFEEDPLLQVLRARRSELRSGLRAVERRLSELTRPAFTGPGSQPARALGSPKERPDSRSIEE
ncbi:proline and serine-rich protein 3 isoform X1 [Macrotis lagotis]|uniref:proline and serine-rich protein 3 isoform X1 n=1 Tax=Macrotis lagotis TaxID=92651 RepID=UPI003D692ED9